MTHTITFQPSGRSIQCADDTEILLAGLNSGVGLPFSCRSGVCRTCRGRIIDGQVDFGHVHPAYLSEAEMADGFVHLCQARPRGDCTIEIDEFDPSLTFPSQRLPVRVLQMKLLASDVMLVVLGTPANEPLRYFAGQYIDVLTKDGLRRS